MKNYGGMEGGKKKLRKFGEEHPLPPPPNLSVSVTVIVCEGRCRINRRPVRASVWQGHAHLILLTQARTTPTRYPSLSTFTSWSSNIIFVARIRTLAWWRRSLPVVTGKPRLSDGKKITIALRASVETDAWKNKEEKNPSWWSFYRKIIISVGESNLLGRLIIFWPWPFH